MNKIFGTVSRGVESVEFMGKQCGIIPQKSGEWPVGKFLLARFWHTKKAASWRVRQLWGVSFSVLALGSFP